MRTTITIEDQLYQKIKANAVNSGMSFKEYLNETLKKALYRPVQKEFKLKWKTHGAKKSPNVPIEDRDRLYDFMERHS